MSTGTERDSIFAKVKEKIDEESAEMQKRKIAMVELKETINKSIVEEKVSL